MKHPAFCFVLLADSNLTRMRLSLAVTVKDEWEYIQKLYPHLVSWMQNPPMGVDVEIVTVSDASPSVVKQFLFAFTAAFPTKFKVYDHALNGDFAEHKNFLNSKCTGDWILQIDADEWIDTGLLDFFPLVIDNNPDVEAYWIPRVNTVRGLTSRGDGRLLDSMRIRRWNLLMTCPTMCLI
jgi:glycosyltransferase involved in cell wall biosynthesis